MISVRTPFRLPLGGGGTDLPSYYQNYGGEVLTAAIDKYMIININVSAIVEKIRISYSKTENIEVNELEKINHDIVRESLKYFNYRKRIDITSMADLPAGTGMGSSSSFTVGLLHALSILNHGNLSKHELAELACEIEINRCKKPIGKQDQYAAAFGGINLIKINKIGKVEISNVVLDSEIVHELEYRLMLFYTGIERDANLLLSEQSRKAGADEIEAIEAMHMIKEIGTKIYKELLCGNIDSIGVLLNEHWRVKKRISTRMTNSKIDHWYDLARKNGAIGGKIMGAGGGGFFLFCVEPNMRKNLRHALEKEGLRFMDFKFDWEGSKLIVNY